MPKCATKPSKRTGIKVQKRAKKFHEIVKKLLEAAKVAKAASKKVHKSKTMTSFSDPSKTYVVSATSCTCPDYKYRRQHRGESCKHMRAFMRAA